MICWTSKGLIPDINVKEREWELRHKRKFMEIVHIYLRRQGGWLVFCRPQGSTRDFSLKNILCSNWHFRKTMLVTCGR